MRRLSIDLGTYAGIPVKLHWSFWLVLLWVAFVGWREGMDLLDTGLFMIFTFCLFFCVLLHEYGHALTARRYDIETQDIILSPIGGIARLQNMPEKPAQEVFVAFAGPAVNVVICLILGILISTMGWNFFPQLSVPSFKSPELFLVMLFWINMMLVIFNLIPAFPMDGGRVLRAVLSFKWSRLTSTRIAVRSGQLIAIGLIILGLWQNQFILPFIGLFVMLTAQSELNVVKQKERLKNTTVGDVMQHDFETLYTDQPVESIYNDNNHQNLKNFVVSDYNGELKGILSRKRQKNHLRKLKTTSLQADMIANPHFEEVQAHQSIQDIINLFNENAYQALPVMTGDIVVGIIEREDLQNWLDLSPRSNLTSLLPFQ